MVFHIFPTVLEVGLVSGLMAHNFGAAHSGVVLGTESLRRSIAMVPQDTVLFHESIGFNSSTVTLMLARTKSRQQRFTI